MNGAPQEGSNSAGSGPAKQFKVSFHGEGFAFFKMKFVQALLIICTLGIYWAWARAATLKYIYGNMEFAGSRFAFSGTGKEMFIGMLKAAGVFGLFVVIFMAAGLMKNQALSVLLVLAAYTGILLLIPVAIYGTMRYRFSRTSWRGIRFRYTGTLKELYVLYLKGVLLSIITLGIYGPFFQVNLRKCLLRNLRFGDARFAFTGEGSDFFWLLFKGTLLTMVTLGLYAFWFFPKQFNFIWGNIDVEREGRKASFAASMKASEFFVFALVTSLITVCTLGIGLPWVMMRSTRFFVGNIEIAGDFNPDALVQGAADRVGAAGEELGSMLDIDSGMLLG